MTGPSLFAGISVRDHATARAFYERILGPPTFEPHATETVWDVAEDRSVYVVEDPAIAGGGRVMLLVEDLDAAVAAVAARGLEPDRTETYENGVRKTIYRDADGNELSFGGLPPSET